MKRFCILFIILFLPIVAIGQSVGLVLSGGGAKGLSHIGVIKALEENNIPIDYISGTSIGSIVGGMYAIGLSPDDMIRIIKSEEFLSWYKGRVEDEFYSNIYKGYPTPAMATIDLMRKDSKIKLSLPSSLVSPYPMDIAVVELFANSSAAAEYDFNNLMIPFFCVAADVVKKEQYIATKGDLGSSIRASMTFPAYFKPIMIDSVLLFDGGFYNNFPWEAMQQLHNPDVIIGAKCVKGEKMSPDQDNMYAQVESMMTVDTDYNLPEEKGILISGIYDYSLLEFEKVDELVAKGYENAMAQMEQIKERVIRRKSASEVDSARVAFRKKCYDLKFTKVEVDGDLSQSKKDYIISTVTNKKDTVSFNEAKRGYFRILSTNTLKTFYPTAKINEGDSTFSLRFVATPKNVLSVSVGGNISSTSLMQGFLGISHTHFSKHPWNAALNMDIGQFFSGVGLYFRQHIGVKPLFIYELMFNLHQFDYFSSTQSLFLTKSLSWNIREFERYATFNAALPLSSKRNLLLELGVSVGYNDYNYYPTLNYTKYDEPDVTNLFYVTPRLRIARSTLNYNMYPTQGKKRFAEFRYIFSKESHTDGTVVESNREIVRPLKHTLIARAKVEDYYNLSKWFSLGYQVDITVSSPMEMNDYISTVMVTPAFQPTLHSRTLILPNYRAPIYAGVAISPIFKFSEVVFLHVTGAYFQPYRQLERTANAEFKYSKILPMGGFMGNIALVWQSPLGPVSLSCAYYDRAENAKWYPSFNIGFLIFREHGLRN